MRLHAGDTEEYVTLVNPLRDMRPAHIHGLASADIRMPLAKARLEVIEGEAVEEVRVELVAAS